MFSALLAKLARVSVCVLIVYGVVIVPLAMYLLNI